MTIYELYIVNNDWKYNTPLRLLNRDNSLYKTVSMAEMEEYDSGLKVFGFSKDEIILHRKAER